MSEVNADGVLLNPQEHLLQEVQNLTNSLMAAKPAGADGDEAMERQVNALNGEPAGTVGGAPPHARQGCGRNSGEEAPQKAGTCRPDRGKGKLGFHHGPGRCGKNTRGTEYAPGWESYRTPRFRGAQRKRRQENG